MQISVYMYICKSTHIYMCVCICPYIYIYMDICTHTHTHTHIYIYICIHAYIYMWSTEYVMQSGPHIISSVSGEPVRYDFVVLIDLQ